MLNLLGEYNQGKRGPSGDSPMPQHLDYRTLFVSSGIVGSALLMLLATQVRKPYPGFLRVILALNALTAGIIAADLRG
jgi:hypothetical protein